MWQQIGRATVILLLWMMLSNAESNTTSSDKKGKLRRFPEGMLFGVSSSAYQIEGGWNASDKTANIWDHSVHTDPWRVLNEENGDVSCDSFHLYKRDVEMLRELGVAFYRFSISWTRVLPTGFSNYISKDGVDYYNNLINELLKYNIKPVVTIFHWDLPQSLQDLGGWTNPLIVTWYEDYARVLFEQFGDRVKTWITINEPQSICRHGYGSKKSGIHFAPFLTNPGIADYLCAQNLLMAHARAYHVYNDTFRATQLGRVGITIQILWAHPCSNSTDDIQASSDYIECAGEIYIHPIFGNGGGFPTNCVQRIVAKSEVQGFPWTRFPQLTPENTAYTKGTADFLGINHYSTILIYRTTSQQGVQPVPSFLDDIDVSYIVNSQWPSSASSLIRKVPWGLRKVLSYFHNKYKGVEMFITENGVPSFGGLQDEDRVDYYRQYLNAVLDAILVDGVNVTGYTAWSLMDNFEWNEGYSTRFGLYEVDFKDPARKRTARKSALVYKEIVRSRVIDPHYEPATMNITIS